jgi:hypothetical protein
MLNYHIEDIGMPEEEQHFFNAPDERNKTMHEESKSRFSRFENWFTIYSGFITMVFFGRRIRADFFDPDDF